MCLNAPAVKQKTGRGKYDWRYVKPEWSIATRAIAVYKVLTSAFNSPYQNFPYSANAELFVKNIRMSHAKRRYSYTHPSLVRVDRGLHACVSMAKAKELARDQGEDTVVVKMTIPKGAKYLRGTRKDIVSNRLYTGDLKVLFKHKEPVATY